LAHSISPRDGVPLLSGSIVPGSDAGGVVTRSANHELRGYRWGAALWTDSDGFDRWFPGLVRIGPGQSKV